MRPYCHLSLGLLLLLAWGTANAQTIDARTQARIDRILKATPLIDGHNDLPWEVRENHQSSVDHLESGGAQRQPPVMTDMARMRAGRVGGQFWSVYISGTITGDAALRATLEQIDTARRLIATYPRHLELASTAADVVRIHRSGKIASMLGMEGGRGISGSMPALRQFYNLGVRYMTLTHNQTTEWADSATDEPRHNGVSPFGAQVIAEMNRVGMLVDLSHVSPDAMKDAIEMSRAPVIFSHSNAFARNPHPRNVPDEVLRLLPARGGVVMVNFYPVFLAADVRGWAVRRMMEDTRLKAYSPFDKKAVEQGLERWEAANPRPATPVATVADHIEHIARTAGHDHVGIGGDLDGVPYTAVGLESVAGYPSLFAELIRRGWSDRNLAKLAGGNVLQAMRGAEAVAASMRDVSPSVEVQEPIR
ncbi:MAG: membrane dipeptidase [Sphingomonas sp.]|nr:membrane dipeptidase [Sphingomonas sp.]